MFIWEIIVKCLFHLRPSSWQLLHTILVQSLTLLEALPLSILDLDILYNSINDSRQVAGAPWSLVMPLIQVLIYIEYTCFCFLCFFKLGHLVKQVCWSPLWLSTQSAGVKPISGHDKHGSAGWGCITKHSVCTLHMGRTRDLHSGCLYRHFWMKLKWFEHRYPYPRGPSGREHLLRSVLKSLFGSQ